MRLTAEEEDALAIGIDATLEEAQALSNRSGSAALFVRRPPSGVGAVLTRSETSAHTQRDTTPGDC